jgi:hypothetical protein
VELADEGAYTCRAQNEGGITDEKVHLLVQSKSMHMIPQIAEASC